MARQTMTLVACGLALALGSGCAVLDSLTRSMVRAGILAPSSPRASGLDHDSIVEVRAGTARGTGVSIEGGYILTAAHVVSGVSRVQIYRHSYIPGAPAAREAATVVWRDPTSDTALIRPANRDCRGSSGDPMEGEAWLVTLAASGRSLSGTTRRAHLRAAHILPIRRFAVDGGVRPGDSGSPLVQCGCVVGVVRSADRYASASKMTAAVTSVEERSTGTAVARARTMPPHERVQGLRYPRRLR